MSDLYVRHFDGASFTNLDLEASNYDKDDFTLNLETDDFLYVGYSKPIFNLYNELKTANTNSATLTVEYYNGTSWVDVPGLKDDSVGFTRSGFITWDNSIDDWGQNEIDTLTANWVRFSTSANFSVSTELRGLNIVFADDFDLKEEFREVMSFLNPNDSTFIAYHQSTAKNIIQHFNNLGRTKTITLTDGSKAASEINKWDLLKISQIREPAKFWCLAKIFFNISDDTDDKWFQLAEMYKKKALKSLELFILDIDKDDDGQLDNNERANFRRIEVTRI